METKSLTGLVSQTITNVEFDWKQSRFCLTTARGDKFRFAGPDATIIRVLLAQGMPSTPLVKAEMFIGDPVDRMVETYFGPALSERNRFQRYVEHRFTTEDSSFTVSWNCIGDGTTRDLPETFWTIPRPWEI